MAASLRSRMSRLPFVRKYALAAVQRTQRDITMSHPWSDHRFNLNSYAHKDYWFNRRRREADTMRRFGEMVKVGDSVLEAGAHIGFVSQYFSWLVGDTGKVVVFEPGSNNLRYLRENTTNLANVLVEASAISDSDGVAVFYEDAISGQNNSLLETYSGIESVAETHWAEAVRTPREVTVRSIDSYLAERGMQIDFLKIDIEGMELAALLGAQETLKSIPAFMVEVTHDMAEISTLLADLGFELSKPDGTGVTEITSPGNYFAVRHHL